MYGLNGLGDYVDSSNGQYTFTTDVTGINEIPNYVPSVDGGYYNPSNNLVDGSFLSSMKDIANGNFTNSPHAANHITTNPLSNNTKALIGFGIISAIVLLAVSNKR